MFFRQQNRSHRCYPSLEFRYLREIADGLDYIHTQRIVHRDIKPTNIYLTQADEIQVTKFRVPVQVLLDCRLRPVR